MLGLIDKYMSKFIDAFDNMLETMVGDDYFTRQTCAAYIIQTAYRKHLIRKYLKLKKEIVKDEHVWHMNIVN